MIGLLLRPQDLDLRGAVEQRRSFGAADLEAQRAAGLRIAPRGSHVPLPVELVVAVDGEADVEAREDRLAVGLDVGHAGTGQLRLPGTEAFEAELDEFRALALDGRRDLISGAVDLGSFGHRSWRRQLVRGAGGIRRAARRG